MNYEQIYEWSNLLLAWRKAAKGKRGSTSCANFEYHLADELLVLQESLKNRDYRPGTYTHFFIHEPKKRKISAAQFKDRVVHHALCNIIEPHFESRFIPDSYANRTNKGTHKAIDRMQSFCRRYRYVLRLDIVKHFPSMDHEILYEVLCQEIHDPDIRQLMKVVIDSGRGIFEQEYDQHLFEGDDLLSLCRARGLPIGNLTSQFWSNCYLHPLDCFIKRELSCKAYLRYVDDFALFSDSKAQLWEWKRKVITKLLAMRLRVHEKSAQVAPVSSGVPWLGFVVYPEYRRVKSRKVIHSDRSLRTAYRDWQSGKITFAEFDTRVQGWINHVRYGDSWGLRKTVLRKFKKNRTPRAVLHPHPNPPPRG